MLTPQDLRHFQKRLESERDAIAARMALRSRDSQETVREESGVGDSGDQATRLDDLDVEADEEAVDRDTRAHGERAPRRNPGGTHSVNGGYGQTHPKTEP